MSGGVIHIAGVHVQIGQLLRQRCAWCGAVLLNYDLTTIAGLIPGDTPGTWAVGGLVMTDGGMQYIVEHADGDTLPDGTCGKLDPAVTL